MGLLNAIKENNRRISDALAGKRAYFSYCTTSLALYRVIARLAPEALHRRVLDVGAGRQAYRALLARCAEQVETLDVNPFDGAVDHVGDVQRLPFDNASYDSIFCSQVLHHVPDPQRALREIARVLRPGGTALISVPHLAWLHNEPHDYFRFTVHGLRRLFENAGLEAVTIEPAGGLICFLGYIPGAAIMGLLWWLRPLFWLALPLNSLAVRLTLVLDRLFGARSLYPVNYIAIVRKPAQETERPEEPT